MHHPWPIYIHRWLILLGGLLCLLGCAPDDGGVDEEPLECTSDAHCASGARCSVEGRCVPTPEDVAVNWDSASLDDPAGWFLWQRYGTRGSTRTEALSADGYGYCGLSDVRTDDLGFRYNTGFPGGTWAEEPVAEVVSGRCGDDLETLSWRLLNCERLTKGLLPLTCDLRLVWIGRQHASDMARRDFFGHVNPDGADPFRRLQARGIEFGAAGENLARQRSVLDAHLAWMDSSLHRRNMLTESYDYVGIGVVQSGHQLLLSEAFVGGLSPEEDELEFIPESRPVFPMERPVQELGTRRTRPPRLPIFGTLPAVPPGAVDALSPEGAAVTPIHRDSGGERGLVPFRDGEVIALPPLDASPPEASSEERVLDVPLDVPPSSSGALETEPVVDEAREI